MLLASSQSEWFNLPPVFGSRQLSLPIWLRYIAAVKFAYLHRAFPRQYIVYIDVWCFRSDRGGAVPWFVICSSVQSDIIPETAGMCILSGITSPCKYKSLNLEYTVSNHKWRWPFDKVRADCPPFAPSGIVTSIMTSLISYSFKINTVYKILRTWLMMHA